MRLAACFDVALEVVEPCGFPLSDRSLRRAALDYASCAKVLRHNGWSAFLEDRARAEGRLVLFTTKGATPLTEFSFAAGDTLIFGRESAGVPEEVHATAEARVLIPIKGRSLNVVTAMAIGLAEALRQTGGFPSSDLSALSPP